MLSVLIPCYNDNPKPLILELIRQGDTLSQPIEILVWDDASNQRLSEKLSALTAESFQINRSEQNQGRSSTRELLARKAKFDWLLFLDADTLPVKADFIKNYLEAIQDHHPIVHGGIAYQEQPPAEQYQLRWTYGREREMQTVKQRNTHPHLVMTGNLMIQKLHFLELNQGMDNFYGDDLLISARILEKQIPVLHIDNPVWHLGLEPSTDYLEKLMESDRMRKSLEKSGQIPADLTSIQRAYHKFKSVLPLWSLIYSPWVKSSRRKILGDQPSLRSLDFYRLYHYLKEN